MIILFVCKASREIGEAGHIMEIDFVNIVGVGVVGAASLVRFVWNEYYSRSHRIDMHITLLNPTVMVAVSGLILDPAYHVYQWQFLIQLL